MLQHERFQIILDKLSKSNAVRVAQLSEEMQVSESTIRRDIIDLDAMGKLQKVFGGAIPAKNGVFTNSFDMSTRADMSSAEKGRIAAYAADKIEDNDFVYIDAGTTTLRMVDYITNTKATYITNGMSHAIKLAKKGCKVYTVAGKIRSMSEAAVGSEAVDSISKYNFTKSFMGSNGVDIEKGFTATDIEEGLIKSAALSRSAICYVLVDSNKFDKKAPVVFAPISKCVIITNKISEDVKSRYMSHTTVEETE